MGASSLLDVETWENLVLKLVGFREFVVKNKKVPV